MRCTTLVTLAFVFVSATAQETNDIKLQNKSTQVTIKLPGKHGFQGGTRFDSSGLVSQVEVGNVKFLGHAHLCPDPWSHNAAGGLAEEFVDPLGYKEAKVGDTFVKIGTGLLKRTTPKPYKFWQKYDLVTPAEWTVKTTETSATFTHELKGPNGYDYRYQKIVALDEKESRLTITHTLTNIGSNPIRTKHYCHNFICIDRKAIDTEYSLTTGFSITGGEPSLPKQVMTDGKRLTLTSPMLPRTDIYSRLKGFDDTVASNRFTIKRRKYAVTMTGDKPLSGFTIYISPNALSAEPFVPVAIEPGNSFTWANRYDFSVSAK